LPLIRLAPLLPAAPARFAAPAPLTRPAEGVIVEKSFAPPEILTTP
jgi:hypothetical protein